MAVMNGLQSTAHRDRGASRPRATSGVPSVLSQPKNELGSDYAEVEDVDFFDMRHIRYFLAVARAGSVSAAAEELRISQPSLSQQIRRLERRIGAALFTRSARGMELTRGGRAFLREVHAIPGQLKAAIAAASSSSTEWAVGVCAGVPAQVLSRVHDALTESTGREATTTCLHMCAVSTVRQATLLHAGELSFGVLRLPLDDPQLVQATVWDEPLGAVMSTNHPLATLDQPQWSDLATQRLLWYQVGCAPGYAEIVPAQLAALGWNPHLHPADAEQQSLFVHALQSTSDLVALRSAASVADHPQLVWRPLPTNRPPRERLALTALAGSPQARILTHKAELLGWARHH